MHQPLFNHIKHKCKALYTCLPNNENWFISTSDEFDDDEKYDISNYQTYTCEGLTYQQQSLTCVPFNAHEYEGRNFSNAVKKTMRLLEVEMPPTP